MFLQRKILEDVNVLGPLAKKLVIEGHEDDARVPPQVTMADAYSALQKAQRRGDTTVALWAAAAIGLTNPNALFGRIVQNALEDTPSLEFFELCCSVHPYVTDVLHVVGKELYTPQEILPLLQLVWVSSKAPKTHAPGWLNVVLAQAVDDFQKTSVVREHVRNVARKYAAKFLTYLQANQTAVRVQTLRDIIPDGHLHADSREHLCKLARVDQFKPLAFSVAVIIAESMVLDPALELMLTASLQIPPDTLEVPKLAVLPAWVFDQHTSFGKRVLARGRDHFFAESLWFKRPIHTPDPLKEDGDAVYAATPGLRARELVEKIVAASPQAKLKLQRPTPAVSQADNKRPRADDDSQPPAKRAVPPPQPPTPPSSQDAATEDRTMVIPLPTVAGYTNLLRAQLITMRHRSATYFAVDASTGEKVALRGPLDTPTKMKDAARVVQSCTLKNILGLPSINATLIDVDGVQYMRSHLVHDYDPTRFQMEGRVLERDVPVSLQTREHHWSTDRLTDSNLARQLMVVLAFRKAFGCSDTCNRNIVVGEDALVYSLDDPLGETGTASGTMFNRSQAKEKYAAALRRHFEFVSARLKKLAETVLELDEVDLQHVDGAPAGMRLPVNLGLGANILMNYASSIDKWEW